MFGRCHRSAASIRAPSRCSHTKRVRRSRRDQARACSSAARSAGSPCVGSTTPLACRAAASARSRPIDRYAFRQPARGDLEPGPRSTSISPAITARTARSRARGRAGLHGRDTPPSRTASRRSHSASPGQAGSGRSGAGAHTGKPSDAASRSCHVEVSTVTTSREPNSARTSSGTAIGSMRISRAPSWIRTPTQALPTRDGSPSSGTRLREAIRLMLERYQLLALGNRSLTERRKGDHHTLAAWPDSAATTATRARSLGRSRQWPVTGSRHLIHPHDSSAPGC